MSSVDLGESESAAGAAARLRGTMAAAARGIALLILCLASVACGGGGGGGGGGNTASSPPSTDAGLSVVTVQGATLDQAFQPSLTRYTASVGFLVTTIRIAATTRDPGATLSINGGTTVGGNASSQVLLGEGVNTLTVEVTAADGRTRQSYQLVVTRQLASAFAQQAYLKASNTTSGFLSPEINFGLFGSSIAVSGNTMAVSAPNEPMAATGIDPDPRSPYVKQYVSDPNGAVYVFVRAATGAWTQQAFIKPPTLDPQSFGVAIALDGDTLAIGAPGGVPTRQAALPCSDPLSSALGAVHVYVRDAAGRWAPQATVRAPNAEPGDHFGCAVALRGDRLAVGASGEDSAARGIDGDQASNAAVNSGAVYLFSRSGANWLPEAYVKASNTGGRADSTGGDGDMFGSALALDGSTLVVGAFREDGATTGIDGDGSNNGLDEAGAVYVFIRSTGGTWSQQAYIKASNTGMFDVFGYSVALSGNQLVVGAPGESSRATGVDGNAADDSMRFAGAAYVFSRDAVTGSWRQQAYLKASNTDAQDRFGWSVAIAADIVVVGAPEEDGGGVGVNAASDNGVNDRGAAYVFAASGSSWTFQAYLKSRTPRSSLAFWNDAKFGEAVAIDGGVVQVGATRESGVTVGPTNALPYRDGSLSGAVEGFERVGGAWRSREFLKASNAAHPPYSGGGELGFDLAFSGDTLVIGAPGDDSGGAGVGADPGGAGAENSGAVYVFVLRNGLWTLQAYVKAPNNGPRPTYALNYSGVRFGSSVAISGDTMVVSAPDDFGVGTGINGSQAPAPDGAGSGAVFIYVRRDGAWSVQAYLKREPGECGPGNEVAISGDLVAIGNGGCTRVSFYSRSGDRWSRDAVFEKRFSSRVSSQFGASVAMSGNTAAVAAPIPFNQGIWIFEKTNGSWIEQGSIGELSIPIADFGMGLALAGNTVAAGTVASRDTCRWQGDPFGPPRTYPYQGQVRIYERSNAGWTLASVIDPPGPQAGACFGAALAMNSDWLLVGAPHESRATSGLLADPLANDTSANSAGAAYLYRRNGSSWVLQKYIKASNARAGSQFGSKVALGDTALAVGSIREPSKATGIDGDQADASIPAAGAVYTFR